MIAAESRMRARVLMSLSDGQTVSERGQHKQSQRRKARTRGLSYWFIAFRARSFLLLQLANFKRYVCTENYSCAARRASQLYGLASGGSAALSDEQSRPGGGRARRRVGRLWR